MSDHQQLRPHSRPAQYVKSLALIGALSVALYALGHALNRQHVAAVTTAAPAAIPTARSSSPAVTPSSDPDPSRTWVRQESTSEIDDSKSLVYAIAATNGLEGWLKTTRPILMARCQKHEVDAILVTQMPASVEYGDRTGHHVRVRFDDGPVTSQRWSESTTNDGLFASNPKGFLSTVAKSKRLRIELTPFNSTPKVVDFHVEGFEEPYSDLLQACGARRK